MEMKKRSFSNHYRVGFIKRAFQLSHVIAISGALLLPELTIAGDSNPVVNGGSCKTCRETLPQEVEKKISDKSRILQNLIRASIKPGATVLTEEGEKLVVNSLSERDQTVELQDGKFNTITRKLSEVAIPADGADIGLGETVYRTGFFSDTQVLVEGIFLNGDILVHDLVLRWDRKHYNEPVCWISGSDRNGTMRFQRVKRSRLIDTKNPMDWNCGASTM